MLNLYYLILQLLNLPFGRALCEAAFLCSIGSAHLDTSKRSRHDTSKHNYKNQDNLCH